MRVAASLVVASLLLPPPSGRILYLYRDETIDTAQCGTGNGPFTPLASTTPSRRAAIARQIDAAGVPSLIDRSLRRASAVIPGIDVTICALAGENIGGLPYLGGVGGVSLGAGHIKLFLHPAPNALERVEYTVAHEYHHEAERALGPRPRFGPLSTVIREGKADNFAVMLYPQLRPPHTQPLTDEELRAAWRQLLEYEKSPDGFGAAFMIGSFPNGTRWPGYRLGFEMVETYLQSVHQTPAEWITAPPEAIKTSFMRTRRFTSVR